MIRAPDEDSLSFLKQELISLRRPVLESRLAHMPFESPKRYNSLV